jgi:hypothetical protein
LCDITCRPFVRVENRFRTTIFSGERKNERPLKGKERARDADSSNSPGVGESSPEHATRHIPIQGASELGGVSRRGDPSGLDLSFLAFELSLSLYIYIYIERERDAVYRK